MKQKFPNKKIIIVVLSAVVLGALFLLYFYGGKEPLNVQNFGNVSDPTNEFLVTKVIDGDTVVISGGDHVRLLGIDADEKNYPCYDAARLRLEGLVLGKVVVLEIDNEDVDQYGRKLRYLFAGDKHINEIMVAEGLAVARFYPENQKYKDDIVVAEASAIKNNIGCKWGGAQQAVALPLDYESKKTNSLLWQRLVGGDIVTPDNAKNYIGKEVIVEGYVAEGYRSQTDTVFLNFSKAYPDNEFMAVIFKSDADKFTANPENLYRGEIVRVKGEISEYQGKYEIILSDATQIEIGN